MFSVPVYSEASGRSNASGSGQVDNSKTISDLQQFVTEFREHDAFIYRDRLRANCLRKEWTLEVEMGHLIGWREDLASRCRNEPGEMLPLVSLFTASNGCMRGTCSPPIYSSRSPSAMWHGIFSSRPRHRKGNALSGNKPCPRSSSNCEAAAVSCSSVNSGSVRRRHHSPFSASS